MTNPICPTGTTYVQVGRFKGGENAKGVCIDTKHVSNKSFNEFLVRTKNRTLSSYKLARKPFASVVDVSCNDARKYCQFWGMRLPTRNEWKWAFYRSGHSLGMKCEWRGTLREFYETGKPSWAAWIRCLNPGFYSRDSQSVSSFRKETNTFRCAVEPKTYWAKQITGLVDGLLLFFARAILGWENPR